MRDTSINHQGINHIVKYSLMLDLAIVSVGDLSLNSALNRYGLVEREDIATLLKAGAPDEPVSFGALSLPPTKE